jgi:DNA-binding GntR family transcriptional regulator
MSPTAAGQGLEGTIRRESTVSRQTEGILREMVLNGTLAPGQRLNEVAIADSIGVSRGPLREAIQKLAGEGLLQLQSHRGAFVRKYEPQEIIEIYEMRIALELYAVRLVIARATDEDLAALESVIEEKTAPNPAAEVEAAPKASGPYVSELDFHQRMVGLAGNAAISAACLEANHRLYLALTHTERSGTRKRHAGSEHLDVLAALRSRDTAAATKLLEAHLEASLQNTLSVLGLGSSSTHSA